MNIKASVVTVVIALILNACGGGDGNGNGKEACESYRLYVANRSDDSVSVVDVCNNVELKKIAAGDGANIWAQDEDNHRIYVSNEESNTITVIDSKNAQAIATLTVENNPKDIAVDETRKLIYITNSGSNSVSVYKTTDFITYTKAVDEIDVGNGPHKVVVNPDSGKAYVAMAIRDVYIINGDDLSALPAIVDVTGGNGNPSLRRVTFNEINKKVYVTRSHSDADDRVAIFNGDAVEVTVKVGEGARRMSTDSVGNIYTADRSNNTVSKILISNNSVSQFNVGQDPNGLKANEAGTTIYTSVSTDDAVNVIEVASGNTTAIGVGLNPVNMDLIEELKRLYVANRGNADDGNTLSVINTENNSVVKTVTIGTNPGGMRFANID